MIKTKWAFEIKWPEPVKTKNWSDDDKERFIKLFRFAPMFELRNAYPHRSKKSIESHGRKLGLKREYKPEALK